MAVADKGYHKAELIKRLNLDQGITTDIPERDTSRRRRWHGDTDTCREFHANRRRASRYGQTRFQKVDGLSLCRFGLFNLAGD